jgi:hypothetical protein
MTSFQNGEETVFPARVSKNHRLRNCLLLYHQQ